MLVRRENFEETCDAYFGDATAHAAGAEVAGVDGWMVGCAKEGQVLVSAV